MPNDTDTDTEDVDVEGSPDAGIDTGDESPLAMPTTPATTGPATPSARNNPMELPGSLAGSILGGLGGNTQPVGQQVQQRHGGLLTGLAGVLLDGLASGMAPTAAMASQMPVIRQQQALQQQQMQMQQQKMQEEMRLAPVREKLLLADTQMKLMQVDHAMQELSDENQLGISDFQKKWVEKAISENRAEEVMEGTTEDVNKWMQDHAHDPDALKMVPYAKQRSADGRTITKTALVKIHPEAMADPINTTLDLVGADGKPMTIPVKIGAGPTSWVNAAGMAVVHGAIAAGNLETKEPTAAGLEERAFQERKQADTVQGKTPPSREQFHQEYTAKEGGGSFQERAFEEAKVKEPNLTREQFQRRWPQTQIAFAGLGLRQTAEARQEAAAQYQTTVNGRPVAGSMAELQAAGIPIGRITKQTAVQQQQTDAARDLISPDGLFAIARRQMADLEGKGKLGPIASRWNNFWAKRGLDGDQQAFRNTLDLLGSRLMAAHLQRTNVSALEHFGKMIPEDSTPDALKKELNEEYKYVLGQGKILGAPSGQ